MNEMASKAQLESPLNGRKCVFSHMGIGCFDIEKQEDFYTRVMGLQVTDRSETVGGGHTVIFLTSDPYDHHQLVLVSGRKEGEIHDTPVPGGSFGTAIFQISFKLDSLMTLRAFHKKFQDEGNTNLMPRNHGNAWSVYTRDPEGNAIELYVDTPWFTHQPCGEPLDFSLSDEEIHQQTEALCRARPDFQPLDEWRREMEGVILEGQSKLV